MRRRFGSAVFYLTLGFLVGLAVASASRRSRPGAGSPSRPAARELRVTSAGSAASILFGSSSEDSPAMWMSQGRGRGSVQLGVHGNGFPFVLVSDAAIRNFGLVRVDGKNASPILVYRSDDVVRLVFGLSMTEAGRPAFLAHYTADGARHDFLGAYCDHPSRACTR